MKHDQTLYADFSIPAYGLKKGDNAIVIEHYPMPEGQEDGYSLEPTFRTEKKNKENKKSPYDKR